MKVSELVERERRHVRRLYDAAAIMFAVAGTLAVVAVGTAALGATRWITLPRAAPFVVWVGVAAAVAAAAAWRRRRMSRHTATAEIAAAIEHEQSMRAGALRATLEVASAGALGRYANERTAARLAGRDALAPRLRRGARGVATRGIAAAVTGLVAMLVLAPAFGDGLSAILLPVRAWRGTLLDSLRFTEVPRTVLRGERARIRLSARERRTIVLSHRLTGEGWREMHLPVSARDGAADAMIGPITADLALVASDGRASTDTVVIHVTDRPFVGDVALQAVFPAYLRRLAEPLAAGEVVRVPRGTTVRVDGRASGGLAQIGLARGRDTVLLALAGHRFHGQFSAFESGEWSWSAAGATARAIDLPPPLRLEVVPDSAPRVEISRPARDTVLVPATPVSLAAIAADDHGLASVVLRTWRVTAAGVAQPPASQLLARDSLAGQWAGDATLEVAERGLEPGDALHVTVVATDASPWHQTGTSRELVLRVPTLEEQRMLARATADSAASGATAAASIARELQRRTEEAARSRGDRGGERTGTGEKSGAPPLGYESAEQARALAKEQRDLAARVQELQRSAQALREQLRQAGALDSALSARLQDAQKLLADALTPELAEQLQKIEDAARSLSGRDTRQSLSELAAQQQKLREQLERSAEMLKRAALEGAMQTLRDEARDVAARERAEGRSGGDKASRELAERSRALSQNVGELSKRLAQAQAETGARKTQAAAGHAASSAESMKRRAAQDAAREMDQAAQQLAEAREQQIGEWKSELTSELDRSVQEMLEMAREEQALERQARDGDSRSSERDGATGEQPNPGETRHQENEQSGKGQQGTGKPEERGRQGEPGPQGSLQARQSAVSQGVETAAERLQKAARKSSLVSPRSQRAMGEARQKVQEATENAQRGRTGEDVAPAMRDAADALTQVAASLVRDRERVNAASSASGFAEMMQQLQELAKQQGALNGQASGLFGSKAPGGAQAREQARALAQAEHQLAGRLDDVGQADPSGRTAELAREARQIAQALEQAPVDQRLLDRQERLFHRLLDAGRSMEKDEREDTGKREAKAATGDNPFLPAGATAAGKAATRFRTPTWSELRGLSPDERRLVIEYFRKLNDAEQP